MCVCLTGRFHCVESDGRAPMFANGGGGEEEEEEQYDPATLFHGNVPFVFPPHVAGQRRCRQTVAC